MADVEDTPATPPPPEPTVLLRQAIDFALRHTPRLGMYATYWPVEDALPLTLADKAAVETALLGLVLSRGPCSPTLGPGQSHALAQAVGSSVDLPRLALIAARHPQTVPSLGVLVAFLEQEHVEPGTLATVVRRAFTDGRAAGTERLPYRQMESAWVAAMLVGNDAPEGILEPLDGRKFAGSILFNRPDPMYVSAIDLYAWTHSVMFMTDFGSRPAGPTVGTRMTGEFLDAACVWQLANDNLDVVGELLMGAAYLGLPWSSHRQLASEVLGRTWAEFGFLPSPSFNRTEFQNLIGPEKTAYAYLHTYHTTYVGALALQAAQRPGIPSRQRLRASSDRTVGDARSEEIDTARATLLSLTEAKGTARWALKAFPSLPEDELLDVLRDAVLVEAAHGYRLDILSRELSAVAAGTSRPSPTARRARDFLAEQLSAARESDLGSVGRDPAPAGQQSQQ
jgi:hypothetical protein